jgi:glycosyltransferase involved in cell wall biosynthesis
MKDENLNPSSRPNPLSGKPPFFSVVIPLYNKSLTISRTLESVLAQSWTDFEILVVNDGSTDKGAEIARSYTDPRIQVIDQSNAGESAARNRGIEEAQADRIAFLDADDEYLPGFLQTIRELMERYPEAGAYTTAFQVRKSFGSFVPKFDGIPGGPWRGLIPNYFKTALNFSPINSSTAVIWKNVFKKVGFFPVGVTHGGDLDMWMRIALNFPMAYDGTCGSIYHWDLEGRAISLEGQVKDFPLIRTAEQALQNPDLAKDTRYYLTEYINLHRIKLARHALLRGDKAMAGKILSGVSTHEFRLKKAGFALLTFLPFNFYRFYRTLRENF